MKKQRMYTILLGIIITTLLHAEATYGQRRARLPLAGLKRHWGANSWGGGLKKKSVSKSLFKNNSSFLTAKPRHIRQGRNGRQKRLTELMHDTKHLGRRERGWLKQESNAVARGKRKTMRNPPQMDLAHPRGLEASKGYDYSHSHLQAKELHRIQHRHDRYGKLQKTKHGIFRHFSDLRAKLLLQKAKV